MMFSAYKKVDGENLYMKNSTTFKVLGVGKVLLNHATILFDSFTNTYLVFCPYFIYKMQS
jgi:hypothetical protein